MSLILCKYIAIVYFFLFCNAALLFHQQGLPMMDLFRLTLVIGSLSVFAVMSSDLRDEDDDDRWLEDAFNAADRSCMLSLFLCIVGFVVTLPFAKDMVLHWILFNLCVMSSCGLVVINKISL